MNFGTGNKRGATELEQLLEASVVATDSGARFVDPATLPTELEVNTAHAQLARAAREGRRWRYE